MSVGPGRQAPMRLGVNARYLTARPTGVQRFAHELVRALAPLVDTTLLVPGGGWSDEGVPPDAKVIEGRLRGPLYEQTELPVAARRSGLDVVLHPASAAPLVGGPHVVVLHDVLPLLQPGDFTLRYRLWARTAHFAAARRAAALVTVSEWSADRIAERLDIPRSRISVAVQGVGPLDRPAAPGQVADLRRRYGLGERFFVAVMGGDPRKGGAFLEAVWEGWLAGEAAGVDLVLVGDTYRTVHRSAPTSLGRAVVHRLGHVPDEDLRALYTGSVALLHPSLAEGFGRPPLEALACGTRVLVAPYGAAEEVLGDAADVVPLDRELWRAALEALLAEPAPRRADRLCAGARHAGRFRWDATATAVLTACEAVARSSR